jgi:CheY-like chemotaxis protein
MSALKRLQPALIILNFPKPDGGIGWGLLQRLKMDDSTARIPILIISSALSFSSDIRAYLLARYIQVIYQPFKLDFLVSLVRRTLSMAIHAGDIFSGNRTLPILLVEDSDDLRETFETVLMLEGYQVVTAANGLLALAAVYQGDYCLILLDINMPIMDGIEFLRLYDRQLRPHAPVIVLSAEMGLEASVFPSFVVDVLSKPFEVSHLLRLAEKYIQPA